MELRQIRYFIEVAKREHVSEAAIHLHVAQSAVSKQITNLEAELGVSLFDREGRNIKLTQIGRIFLDYAVIAMEAIDNATKQIDEYLDPTRGIVRIGFPTSLSSYMLPNIISAFKAEYPDIGFLLRQGSYKFLIEAVKSGDIDVAFLGPVPKHDLEIESHILFTEKILALLPASHPLADKDRIHLGALRKDEFVSFPKGFVLEEMLVDACKQAGFSPSISTQGEDLDAIKGLVAAGIGVTLLPENTFYGSTPNMTVKIPVDMPEVKRTVGIIKKKGKELAPSENVFYEFVKQFFRRMQEFQ